MLLRHASLFRLQVRDQMILTVDQLVNHFRPGLVQKRRSKASSFVFFYHHLRTLSTALASGVGATIMFDSICRVVSGDKLVRCTERSSFAFHLPFLWWASRSLAQACGSVMAVSWQSNVIVSESLRLSTLQPEPIGFTFIHLSDRFRKASFSASEFSVLV